MKIKYDMALIKLLTLFESRTRVKVRDVFEDDFSLLHFVVGPGMMSKALGKEAAHVKKLSLQLNRKIKIVEFNPGRETFIKRLLFPLKVEEITSEGDLVTIKGVDKETNSRIIGRQAVNLRNYEKIVKRFFPLEEIKVI